METTEDEQWKVKVEKDECLNKMVITIEQPLEDLSYGYKILKMLSDDSNFLKTNKKRVASLSEREKEVFGLVALGYSSEMIADKLFISKHTAQTHRKRLKEKLKIKSQKDISTYARVFGFV